MEERRVEGGETLRRWEIVRHHRDLKAIMLYGEKITGAALSLYYYKQSESRLPESGASPPPTRRVAFILNRKIKGAVVRNHLKRRLREIFRRNKGWFPLGFDYAIKARVEATELDFHRLAEELHSLAERIRKC